MADNNNRQPNSPRGNKSTFQFILPYLVILGIVIFLLFNVGNWFGNTTRQYTARGLITELQTVDTSNVESIIVSQKETVIDISGVIVENGEKISFTAVVPNYYESQLFPALERFGTKVTIENAFQTNLFSSLLIYLIPIGLVVILGLIFMSKMGGANGNKQAFDFGKSPVKRIENSKVKFADVAGCEEEKAEMVELVEYLKNPKKFSKMGARIPKGVILKGAPGTGKTLLAKSVAGEAGVPFLSISGSDFVEMFVGVGASRVRDMFKKAKQLAPSILFIDEIDAVGRQRGAGLGGGHDEREQTLNQLLVEMDGFEDNAGIIVIAATNRPDVLDPALLRPGRFDRQITVDLPDRKGREAILKVHARNKKIAAEVNFENIASRTPGFSGAELENVLNEAAILAVRTDKTEITTEDIDEAIDRVMGGPAKTSKIITPREKTLVAYHESGHAMVGLKLANAMRVQKVTIIPRGEAGGYVLMTPTDDRFLNTKGELLDRIAGLLAGRVSEEIFFDDVTTGAHNDIEQATKIARSMVTELGMSSLGPIQYERQAGSVFLGRDYTNSQRNFSSEVAYEIDKEIQKIVNESMARARKILLDNKDKVELIAKTLLDKETLTNEEVVSLVETGELPKKEKKVEPEVQPQVQQEIKEPTKEENVPSKEDSSESKE
ncbi:MAG: ATP-dependent zinc metalloprotease FtsH [Bacilli bacterium]|nr:ATP-dependent zinc metalloprotease FtsH [Bacilli bacterium]